MHNKERTYNQSNKLGPWSNFPYQWVDLPGTYVNMCPVCKTRKKALLTIGVLFSVLILLWLLSGCASVHPPVVRNNEEGTSVCLYVVDIDRDVCILVGSPTLPTPEDVESPL